MEVVDCVLSIPMHIGHRGTLHPVRYLKNLTDDLILGIDVIKRMEINIICAGTNEWWYESEPDKIYKFITRYQTSSTPCYRIANYPNSRDNCYKL